MAAILQSVTSRFIQEVTYLLKNESYMYSTARRVDLRLLLVIRRVTVKWETVKSCIFWMKTWKWHQNGIKLCSGNLTFFRSNTLNPLYPLSNSWHYPFHCWRIGAIFLSCLLSKLQYTIRTLLLSIFTFWWRIFYWKCILWWLDPAVSELRIWSGSNLLILSVYCTLLLRMYI